MSRLEHEVRVADDTLPVSVNSAAIKAQRSGTGADAGDATESAAMGSPLAAPPANDACASATPISGVGTFAFNTTEATTDGPSHAACIDDVVAPGEGGIARDVWYCWTAPCSGAVRIDTCGLTNVDTRLAVYNGCACPGTDARILACDDDSNLCTPGTQSEIDFLAQAGQTYLVRVGVFPSASGGTGSIRITCLDAPCDEPAAHCQSLDISNGRLSDGVTARTADNFRPKANGTVSEVCFWGSYIDDAPEADSFQITYFSDMNGLPNSVIAGPFVQGGSLTVSPAVLVDNIFFPVFEYTATHAPVPVSAGQCYWIQIANLAGSGVWYWQLGFGGDNTIRQDGDPLNGYGESDVVRVDMALCLNLLLDDADLCSPPPNSACPNTGQDCCTESSSGLAMGCEDSACCRKVCACDEFCCSSVWDNACAGMGAIGTSSCTASRFPCLVDDDCKTCCSSGLPCTSSADCPGGEACLLTQHCEGCGAMDRCGNLCIGCPQTTLTFIDPPLVSGRVVDARAPHAPTDATQWRGIDRLTVGAAADVSQVGCWSLCETEQSCGANQIMNVVNNLNGTYTVMFSRPITGGATTRITYTSDTAATQTAVLISHPGNVNASTQTNAQDITQMIDRCLRGLAPPPEHGLYSCDINHSGSVNVSDITALIDLLNGAGAFDPWVQTTISPDTCP